MEQGDGMMETNRGLNLLILLLCALLLYVGLHILVKGDGVPERTKAAMAELRK